MANLSIRLRASAQVMRKLPRIDDGWAREVNSPVALRIARELEEAAQALEASQWMPIETAPKDGTMFLCWVSAVRYVETDEGQRYQEEVSQIDFCQWRTQADIPDCGWFEPFCGQIGHEQDVTLWAPLPVAPGAQVAQEGAAGVSALPTPKLCPGCAQYHGRNDCPVGWLAPAEPYGVPASEYLAKIEADPRRAAALQRARDRARGVATDQPNQEGGRG